MTRIPAAIGICATIVLGQVALDDQKFHLTRHGSGLPDDDVPADT